MYTFEDRYFPEPNTGCWLWMGKPNGAGYGRITIQYQEMRAHRWSWNLHRGFIPDDICVLHKCDTRSCVNPDHLFLGTREENQYDMARKGRAASGDRSGQRKYPERSPRGESHGLSKLTVQEVREIRGLATNSRLTYTAIGEMFQVSRTAIGHIVYRRRWSHVN